MFKNIYFNIIIVICRIKNIFDDKVEINVLLFFIFCKVNII